MAGGRGGKRPPIPKEWSCRTGARCRTTEGPQATGPLGSAACYHPLEYLVPHHRPSNPLTAEPPYLYTWTPFTSMLLYHYTSILHHSRTAGSEHPHRRALPLQQPSCRMDLLPHREMTDHDHMPPCTHEHMSTWAHEHMSTCSSPSLCLRLLGGFGCSAVQVLRSSGPSAGQSGWMVRPGIEVAGGQWSVGWGGWVGKEVQPGS